MLGHFKLMCFAVVFGMSAQAKAADWQLQPEDGIHGALLTLVSDGPVAYRFECKGHEVFVTQTGVTGLLDLKTGGRVGDDADAIMPEGAAVMAVFAGKGDPEFVPAEAIKNPAGGWDLTIRLPKNDRQLKAIGKSDMMSLFTTGYTMAVMMDSEARTKWKDFMRQCAQSAQR